MPWDSPSPARDESVLAGGGAGGGGVSPLQAANPATIIKYKNVALAKCLMLSSLSD